MSSTLNGATYFLCVLYEHRKEKKVVPVDWCFDLLNIHQIDYNKTYKIFFSENIGAEPDIGLSEDAYIFKSFSK